MADMTLPPALPRTAAALLAAARRRLYRQRATGSLAAAAWIVTASACGAAGIHLLYRALGPAALTVPPAIILAAALGYTLIRAPSRLDAAAFIDYALEGHFAYRTLLELAEPAPARRRPPDPVAVAAFLQWVTAHAQRAEPELRSRPAAPWPRGALACAAAALALAAVLLQLPGALPHGAAAAGSGESVPFLARTETPRASQADRASRASDVSQPTSPGEAAAPTDRGGARNSSTQQSASDSAAARAAHGTNTHAAGFSSASAPPADAAGLQAGAARDTLIAAQLARAVQLAPIERVATRAGTQQSASRRSGGPFEGDSLGVLSSSNVDSSAGTVAAAEPPRALAPVGSGPIAQVLIGRYFARLGRDPAAPPARHQHSAGDLP